MQHKSYFILILLVLWDMLLCNHHLQKKDLPHNSYTITRINKFRTLKGNLCKLSCQGHHNNQVYSDQDKFYHYLQKIQADKALHKENVARNNKIHQDNLAHIPFACLKQQVFYNYLGNL